MIDKALEKYAPTQIVVVYENKSSSSYLEIHSVKEGKIFEGRPLKKKTLEELLRACSDKTEIRLPFRGRMQSNILYYNCDSNNPTLVWYEPMKSRRLIFGKSMTTGEYVVPPAVFAFRNYHLHIYAVKALNEKDINDNEVLYNYPLPNIYDGGSVCMGDVDMETANYECVEDLLEGLSEKFWDSKFTEFHADHPLKDENVYEFWKKQLQNPTGFPLEVLMKTDSKLKNLYKGKWNH